MPIFNGVLKRQAPGFASYRSKVILLSFLFFIGTATDFRAQTTAELTVTIHNSKPTDSIQLNIPYFWQLVSENKTLPQTGLGTFSANIPVSQPRLVYLYFRKRWLKLYIEPQRNLSVSFHADSLMQTLRFSGQSAGENEILNQMGFTTYNMSLHAWKGQPTTSEEIVNQLLREKQIQLAKLMELKKKELFSSTFYNLLEGEIQYKPPLELSNLYLYGLANTTRRQYQQALKKTFDNLPFSEDRFLDSDIYFYVAGRTAIALDATCAGDSLCELQETRRIFKIASLEEFEQNYGQFGQLYQEIHRSEHYFSGKTLEKLMAGWIHTFKSDYLYLRPAYDHYKSRFPDGKHAKLIEEDMKGFFMFEKQPSNINQIKFVHNPDQISTINDLLKTHQGRVVYVDFWGSWCGSCRDEVPHAARLKEKFKGQPVDFLYIAYEHGNDDAHIRRWKSVVQKLQITGEHYMMTPEFFSSLKQVVNVTAFPTYVIFDKNGKLVNQKAAHPSEAYVIEQQIREAMNP